MIFIFLTVRYLTPLCTEIKTMRCMSILIYETVIENKLISCLVIALTNHRILMNPDFIYTNLDLSNSFVLNNNILAFELIYIHI